MAMAIPELANAPKSRRGKFAGEGLATQDSQEPGRVSAGALYPGSNWDAPISAFNRIFENSQVVTGPIRHGATLTLRDSVTPHLVLAQHLAPRHRGQGPICIWWYCLPDKADTPITEQEIAAASMDTAEAGNGVE